MKVIREYGNLSLVLIVIALQTLSLAGCSIGQNITMQKAVHACNLESLPQLPDVTITAVTQDIVAPEADISVLLNPLKICDIYFVSKVKAFASGNRCRGLVCTVWL
jgi:hypothetical protein